MTGYFVLIITSQEVIGARTGKEVQVYFMLRRVDERKYYLRSKQEKYELRLKQSGPP